MTPADKLVAIHKAQSRVTAELIAGYLRDNGVEASIEAPSRAESAARAGYCEFDESCEVSVLEHDAAQARQLVLEFLAAQPADVSLEELAAQPPHPDREEIHRLRGALREERQTFEFLAWLVFAVCVGIWMMASCPIPPTPVALLACLVIGALIAGSWLRRRL